VVSLDGHQPLSGQRVLIVEDEYFLANDIELGLRSLGAEIAGPVGYLEDGLAILNGVGGLDGAVLDINIGGERIFPLARELQRRRLPFVFTSGYDPVLIGAEFADAPLFEKPIDIVALTTQLVEMIRSRHPDAGSPSIPVPSSI
jgi:DNA-binding LytR/AlgR family response regulator